MQPLRIVRSEAELEAVAPGSLVCAAYSLRTIFEKQNTNEWVEPGCESAWSTAAVWEHMTGAYETIILDEDREVWSSSTPLPPSWSDRPARPTPTTTSPAHDPGTATPNG